MQHSNLDLSTVDVNYKGESLAVMCGLSDKEANALASKMTKITVQVNEDELRTIVDVAPVLLPQLTAKEATLLLLIGIESSISDTLSKGIPVEQLRKFLSLSES